MYHIRVAAPVRIWYVRIIKESVKMIGVTENILMINDHKINMRKEHRTLRSVSEASSKAVKQRSKMNDDRWKSFPGDQFDPAFQWHIFLILTDSLLILTYCISYEHTISFFNNNPNIWKWAIYYSCSKLPNYHYDDKQKKAQISLTKMSHSNTTHVFINSITYKERTIPYKVLGITIV